MTENTGPIPAAEQAPPPPYTTRPPLHRSRTDRVVSGVAGGIGEWLGIDPVIVRVVLVVLAIFGGSGLILYAIGWLFLPDEGTTQSEARKLFDSSGGPGTAGRIAFSIVAVGLGMILLVSLAAAGSWGGIWGFGGGGSLLLLVASGLVVLWLVRQGGEMSMSTAGQVPRAAVVPRMADATAPTTPAPEAMVLSTAAADTVVSDTTGFAYGGQGDYPGYVPPVFTPPAPRPPRPRSYLGAATVSLTLIVMGVLGALSLAGALTIPAVVVLAAGLGVLGLGLLVGTFVGRARWLIALALPLLLVTSIVAFLPTNLQLGDGIGERSWTPRTPAAAAANHQLSVGTAELDLTKLDLPAGSSSAYPVRASVGAGELLVTVPEGMNVNVIATVGTGEIAVEGLPVRNGQDVEVVAELPGLVSESSPTVDLIVDVAIGNLEVSRA